ncbi:hypothetical protein D6817_00915 [Candidatus Pacearchaeota archaeon]|nr:MAG: hypothetical protein D6817_00915 [Candidatus Pacearchaeota archaeon]
MRRGALSSPRRIVREKCWQLAREFCLCSMTQWLTHANLALRLARERQTAFPVGAKKKRAQNARMDRQTINL